MIMSIKVLIADDHQLFREGITNLLKASPDLEIVGQAENGKEAVEKTLELKPDIILMDIGMPEMSGIEATLTLKKEIPEIKIIALSMHSDKQFINGMLEAGASGYLLKNSTYNQLIEAIKSVYSGNKYLSGEVTDIVINDYLDKKQEANKREAELSERESEILLMIAEGYSTREIGEKLFISVKTVGTHKQKILEKLNLNNTAEMVKYAIKNGLIEL